MLNLILRTAIVLVFAVLVTSSASAQSAEDSLYCITARSAPPPCKGCSPYVAEKIRQKDMKRMREAQKICDQLKREEAKRKEEERQQQEVRAAKQKEESERRRKAEKARQDAAAALAIEMRKPINQLRAAYMQYLYVGACYQARQGYLVVWINDVEMERARQAVSRLEEKILKEDSTISTAEVWREMDRSRSSTIYEYTCRSAYNQLIMSAPSLPTTKDFGQH